MDDLTSRSLRGLAGFLLAFAVLVLLPGGLDYWQGWLYLAVFGAATLAITLYFLRFDRGLIERRLRAGPGAEPDPVQRRIQTAASVALLVLLLGSALNHRFNPGAVAAPLSLAADAAALVGFAVIFVVFRANSYTSGVVEVGAEQPLITSGPYGVVRHPMYAGALLLFLATPLALDSWWGLLPAVALVAVLVMRLRAEERTLTAELPGYVAYTHRTRWRLVPLLY